jgi:phosphotransferase system HPr-like phosphotransfer protein
MPRAEAEIVNKLGLHARASAKLCKLAGGYSLRGLDLERGTSAASTPRASWA